MSAHSSITEMESQVAPGFIKNISKDKCANFLVDNCQFQQNRFTVSHNGWDTEGKCFGFSLDFLILISTKHKDNPVAALQEMRSRKILPAPGQMLHDQYGSLLHQYKAAPTQEKGIKQRAKHALLLSLCKDGRFPSNNTRQARFYLKDYEFRRGSPAVPRHETFRMEGAAEHVERQKVSVGNILNRNAAPLRSVLWQTVIPKFSTAHDKFAGTTTSRSSRKAIDFAYDAFAGDIYNFLLECRKSYSKYFQISVRLMEGGKHALALFMSGNAYYIFDPNTGLYMQDITGLPEYRQDGGTPHELLLHAIRAYAADRVSVLCISTAAHGLTREIQETRETP